METIQPTKAHRTACFQEWDPLATNLKGIKDICLPVVCTYQIFSLSPKTSFLADNLIFSDVLNEALGYLVDVEPETTNTFSPTIVFVSYTIPIFFILAWLATLIGTITTGHPHHYIVKGAAVVLTGVSVGSQYVLFTTAKLAAPNLGVTAATSLGVGSSNPFPLTTNKILSHHLNIIYLN